MLNPCTISVIEPTAEDVSMKENQDDDIQIIEDNIEDMDCDVMIIEKDNSTFDMIKSIVDEIVMTATRPSRDEFIMSLVMDMACLFILNYIRFRLRIRIDCCCRLCTVLCHW